MTTLPSPKPHRIRPPGTPSANRPLPRNLPLPRSALLSHAPPPSNGLPTYPNPPSANPPYLSRLYRVSGSIFPPPPGPCQATSLLTAYHFWGRQGARRSPPMGVVTPSPTEVKPMGPMVRYPMWKSLLSPFRRSQQKTLALVMAAAASSLRPAGDSTGQCLESAFAEPPGR
jgi:hypothetical protein